MTNYYESKENSKIECGSIDYKPSAIGNIYPGFAPYYIDMWRRWQDYSGHSEKLFCLTRATEKHQRKRSVLLFNRIKERVVGYESGMTMVEIAKRNNVSERTIYRYKAYYDKLREKEE